MTLLRCPKFLRCLTADAGNFYRGHSLTSLLLPLAALSSLPTSARTQALLVTPPYGRGSAPPDTGSSPCYAPVGIGLPDDPPGLAPHPMKCIGRGALTPPQATLRSSCNLSLRDQFANWSWQSASPVLKAPLPKGGWHGEAVTGGFLTPPRLL